MQSKLKTCARCALEKFIYKNIAGKKYCKECAMILEPPGAIRSRSVKRAKQERQYTKRNNVKKLEDGVCIAGLPGCTGYDVSTLTTQHLKGRIGDLLLDEKHQITICYMCHVKVNNNPKMARALGLEKSRLSIEQDPLET